MPSFTAIQRGASFFVRRAVSSAMSSLVAAGFAAIGNASDVVDRAVVSGLDLVGILDHLVDEIAEVQNETEPLSGGSAFVLVDHPAIGVQRAFIDILAAAR